ncbi:methyltransferase domain-containing protein [Actinoplanes sp. TRM 88003]|uniref:Methyltransferase domain-containing protein n=1 Tax=Paractinoplanes aksuensis TaxID=2939490 RepID=A0ABT1DPK1_9ACTN|nr:class I SAM-dependent methyltransferase [Actinoplanes aksuensis]MCO8271676.1 methyltransferase domain-containing protein [Actinoplanes aksuensis]
MTAEEFWEKQYRAHQAWGGRANPLLVEVASPLTPGTALDLGCGAGGDAVWLARRGWQVTAVDISPTAVDKVRGHGLPITAEQHDLAQTFPSGTFDLISAQYFQTPLPLDRAQVLRTAAHALHPGGRLLVVDHGSIAPWSWNQDPDTHFPTPTEVAAELALDPAQFAVARADRPQREATGPGGRTAQVTDNVLIIRRAAA